jgi:hypothetical protein
LSGILYPVGLLIYVFYQNSDGKSFI